MQSPEGWGLLKPRSLNFPLGTILILQSYGETVAKLRRHLFNMNVTLMLTTTGVAWSCRGPAGSLNMISVTGKSWLKSYNSINPLTAGRCGSNCKSVITEHILKDTTTTTACEIAFWWMPQNTSGDKSTLVQAVAWRQQATSHYLSRWAICYTDIH